MVTKRLNILFLASEAEPFVKIGGLGDVAGSLPPTIHSLSNSEMFYDIRLALPFYGSIKKKFPGLPKVKEFKLHTGSLTILTSVFEYEIKGTPVYFIDGQPIKEEDPVYGTNFSSDAEKFIFFSLACLELPRVLKWDVDILHANDWHTAIAIHQSAKMKESRPGFAKIKKVLTLHNLPYMGAGSEEALAKFGIEPADDRALPIWARTIPLPMGLSSADRIVPVSPTYAEEILTAEFGCGLEDYFQAKKDKIQGIVNGIDYSTWDPLVDTEITTNYGIENLSQKKECKKALQQEMDLALNDHIPLIILISRMDQQKGVDLAIDALRKIEKLKWQSIILGTGDSTLERAALDLQTTMPGNIRSRILFNSSLSHRMYAGADILLMPSRYEPCGLSQLIAMKYGTIPVARATGGLKDTIIDIREKDKATGFLFSKPNSEETAGAVEKAISTHKTGKTWEKIVHNAMKQDFSWTESAKKYCALYHELISGQDPEEK
jgi:starch synthase